MIRSSLRGDRIPHIEDEGEDAKFRKSGIVKLVPAA